MVAHPASDISDRHLNFTSIYVIPIGGGDRSYGFSVRRAEEKETHKFNIKPEMDGQYYNLWSTDTIGLLVLTIRTTVQDTSTHCTAATVVGDSLFAAQRRRS